MSFEVPGFTITLVAVEDFPRPGTFGSVDANGLVAIADGTGTADFLVHNKPLSGKGATCMCSGVGMVQAAVDIVAGEVIYPDATGFATNVAGAAKRVGIAVDTATAGNTVSVLMSQDFS